MEKLSHLDKVINEEVLRVNEDRRNSELLSGKGNISVFIVLRHDGLLCEIIESRMMGKSTRGGEEFKCYMIWQRMMAMLHLNEQQRTGRMETEKGCQTCSIADYWSGLNRR